MYNNQHLYKPSLTTWGLMEVGKSCC